MPVTQIIGHPIDLGAATTTTPASTTPRPVFPPGSSALGFFIQQDSFYGNTFIPVLPRLDPLPTPPVQQQPQAPHYPTAK